MERTVYRQRGVLIATDYLVNSGGVIFAAQEQLINTPEHLRLPAAMRGNRTAVEHWLVEHAEEFAALAEQRRQVAESYRETVIRNNMRELADLLIAEMPDEALYRSLAHLQAAEFLYETRLFPEQVYTFKHALTHEVAYSSLLQERRRVLHAGIVAAIEQLYTDRLTEEAERLAHHAFRSEVWEKAFTYCQQTAAKATGRSAHRRGRGAL